MKTVILAILTFLICGVRITDSSAMTAGLYMHYLIGSGESVTVHSPELLKLCEQEGLNTAYDSPYQNAVGRFTCKSDGTAYDLYDFADLTPSSSNLMHCLNDNITAVIDDEGLFLDMDVAGLARCLPEKGIGTPFHVEIKP